MSSPTAKQLWYLFGNGKFAVSARSPVEIWMGWNSQVLAAHTTIANEMQNFIAGRVDEDYALVRRVSHCRAPHEFVAVYTDFWRKVAEDYSKEATTLGKIMTSATNKMVVAAQAGVDEGTRTVRSTTRSR